MKFAWGLKLYDSAAWNTLQAKTCIIDFKHLLVKDGDLENWQKEIGSNSDEYFSEY